MTDVTEPTNRKTPEVRIRRRVLMTPNYGLVHPDTERRVRVIGLIHAGEPGYYLQIKQLVEMLRLGGAQVHSEGTGLGDLIRNPPPDLTAEEKEILDLQVAADRGAARHATPDPAWVHQYAGFGGWPTGWQRIDLPYLQELRAIGTEPIGRQLRLALASQGSGPAPSKTRTRMPRHGAAWAYRFAAAGIHGPRKATDPVRIDRRNAVALAGVDATTRDVVLLWGTAHVPGLVAGLKARGFRPGTKCGTGSGGFPACR
jgi:hypothetical protein